jgi:hypothetical protein
LREGKTSINQAYKTVTSSDPKPDPFLMAFAVKDIEDLARTHYNRCPEERRPAFIANLRSVPDRLVNPPKTITVTFRGSTRKHTSRTKTSTRKAARR